MNQSKRCIESHLVTGYLNRRAIELRDTIDKVPVFGKRYRDAADELEEVEELLELIVELRKAKR